MMQTPSPLAISFPDGEGIVSFHRKYIHATVVTDRQLLIRNFINALPHHLLVIPFSFYHRCIYLTNDSITSGMQTKTH